jgi:uncharacterized Zn-finger protein
MSISRNTMVICPKCKQQFQTTVFDSINTNYDETVAMSIITGKRFSATCPYCGDTSSLEYDVLYHDIKHRAMIWVIHKDETDYKKKIEAVRGLNTWALSTTRIVSDMTELAEKVLCLETNKDDRVVELCKFIVRNDLEGKRPDFIVSNIVYTLSKNNKEVLVCYSDGKNPAIANMDKNLYVSVEKMFQDELSKAVPSCSIIDRQWVDTVVMNYIEKHPVDFSDNNENYQTHDKVVPTTVNSKGASHFCRKCGKRLLPDSVFCSFCGTRVE